MLFLLIGIADNTFQRRCLLPAFSKSRNNVNIFGLLSKSIGKDLSKISMPVDMNEPLSALQVIFFYIKLDFSRYITLTVNQSLKLLSYNNFTTDLYLDTVMYIMM